MTEQDLNHYYQHGVRLALEKVAIWPFSSEENKEEPIDISKLLGVTYNQEGDPSWFGVGKNDALMSGASTVGTPLATLALAGAGGGGLYGAMSSAPDASLKDKLIRAGLFGLGGSLAMSGAGAYGLYGTARSAEQNVRDLGRRVSRHKDFNPVLGKIMRHFLDKPNLIPGIT